MDTALVLEIARQAILTAFYVAGPILLVSMVVGIVISILQATTQINEQTLTFVPKLIAIALSLLIFGQWMLTKVIEFTRYLWTNINQFVK
ncbi:flagellar biosynthetic protein FliQ [Caldicellulosiruptor acetigenus I77R1B]|uniref:Flagellar biosynthetic protein FliQ n=2 Tax=Caldicellulosiruptor acetigenus TaxID=301953 RepID=G2PUW0_9FIRM|nr:flagellar biosynthesis protein FliQ [Caldicellulosiruptor acetigenus]ADQ39974.1 flagellar biosynthetic protein FliQ [Caldicellulosiruptor acetigenus I77R1B]AEM74512.1 flagellar biosynthetic protein FliQ [Caldicellulosiruptor acetigenus 6A]WAM36789.1 flagellar biosynthesis protein FliQ [Caldicellulosiruptor acetigenus]